MKNLDFYRLAQDKFIDLSSGDPTAVIAKEHGILGLTRLLVCMDSLGIDIEPVSFVALPDFTYTRNSSRWNAGFPYGCIITLGDSNSSFIPIDFRPNCCGVICVKLNNFVKETDYYIKNFNSLVKNHDEIDKTDFNRRNHFIGIYKSNNEYYGLIHGSFKFIKEAMYSNHNKELYHRIKKMEILGSEISYLIGNEADEYYNYYLSLEQKSIEYRTQIAECLFPNSEVIFHKIHEGFFSKNTILLGAYADNKPFSYPLMLSPEINLPLVTVNTPVSTNSGSFYCAPHGGGYGLSNVQQAKYVENEYTLIYSNGASMITNNIIDMPFFYRKNVGEIWCERYKMGEIERNFQPIYNFKI